MSRKTAVIFDSHVLQVHENQMREYQMKEYGLSRLQFEYYDALCNLLIEDYNKLPSSLFEKIQQSTAWEGEKLYQAIADWVKENYKL